MIISSSIPVYRCDVAYFLETTVEELQEFYKNNRKNMDDDVLKEIKKDIENSGEVAGAVYTCGVNYIMYIRDIRKKGHIAHELYHLTNCVLIDRGVEHTRCDEPFAYLNEFLHDSFDDVKKEFKRLKKDEKSKGNTGKGTEPDREGEVPEGGVHSECTV